MKKSLSVILGIIAVLMLVVFVSGCSQQNNSTTQTKSAPAKTPLTVEIATKLIQKDIEDGKYSITDKTGNTVVANVSSLHDVKIINSTDTEAYVTFYLDSIQINPTKLITNENGEWIKP